jgi:uncharacterized protein (TIGR00299 family) protein
MRQAYFDCQSGVSGDMIVGALLDAGLDIETLRGQLALLGLADCRVEASRVKRHGITGTKFSVVTREHGHEHRRLADILGIVRGSDLSERVKHDAERVFRRLARAEASVHGTDVSEVHFHEIGAVDSIVDVVGAAIGMERLGIERIAVSVLPTGSGFIECEHGTLPAPAPAVAELLKGFPVTAGEVEAELTTPTGAALLTTLGEHFGKIPSMTVESVGYGAGSRDFEEIPNLLRVIIGQTPAGTESDRMWVLETNIDDMPAELYETVFEKLLSAGVMDVFTTPIQMKKGRPAVKLSVLTALELRQKAEEIIFRETTTFGIRAYEVERRKLARESVTVRTEFGEVSVKLGRLGGDLVTVSPEYEDCRKLASRHGVALKDVYEKARLAARDLT